MRTVAALVLALGLSGCAADKVAHMAAGAGIGAVGEELTGQGCLLSLAAGVAKEVVDPIFSTMDVLATAAICAPLLLS